MRLHLAFPLVVLPLLAACPVDPPAEEDPTPFVPVRWQKVQPPIDAAPRGLTEIRGIAHLHSPYSHDACDSDPQPGGVPDEACYFELRQGLCRTRIHVAFLSDHRTHSNEAPFEDLLLLRDGDFPVLDDEGVAIANDMACPPEDEGHRVLLIPGIEANPLMPLGTVRQTPELYGDATAENVAALKEAGALAWVAHAETHSIESLRGVGIEGIELYQLHANLAPDLRELLGLDPYTFISELGPFLLERDGLYSPEPDLAMLGFVALNGPAIEMLEVLGQEQRLGVTGGSDSHRNVLESPAWDGERIDSYRRSFRWMSNRLRIEGELTPDSAKEALREARSYIVMESLGTPLGFDFRATTADGVHEMGAVIPADGATLTVVPPTLDPRSPRGEATPGIRTLLYWSDGVERVLLGESSGSEPISVAAPGPGVARVEVWITPRHLAPYLGEYIDVYSELETIWVQTGGIFLR